MPSTTPPFTSLTTHSQPKSPSDASARERAQWTQLAATLAGIQASCLRSSEYYALLGAAQLNSAQLESASESLERALLLDPNNGAAQIDFASALFASGQLFPALQLNERVTRAR